MDWSVGYARMLRRGARGVGAEAAPMIAISADVAWKKALMGAGSAKTFRVTRASLPMKLGRDYA